MSEVISFLRFPLAVLIVLMHARFQSGAIGDSYFSYSWEHFPFYSSISSIMSDFICQIAVPLFFMFSGYLFFYNVESFSLEIYKHKLQRRVHSLLIPYLFWNSLILILYIFIQTLFPVLTSGVNKFITSYTLSDWLHAYWDINGGPIALQFWFIRDLMVISVLSPIIYFLIKNMSFISIAVFGVLWFLGFYTGITAMETRTTFFFSLGALFTIKKYDMLRFCNCLFIPCALISIAVIVLKLLYNNHLFDWITPYFVKVDRIGLLSLMIVCIACTSRLLKYNLVSVNRFLLESNFFIYAYHGVALALIAKIVLKYFTPQNELQAIIVYIFNPTLTICIGLCLFALLMKCFPRFTKIITGNRASV